MLLSVFTPTNNTKYLNETYQSLKSQTYKNWEWVLCPNQLEGTISEEIRKDARVRIVPVEIKDQPIGGLKRFACDNCKGDVFVELDHDDMLVPTVLREVFGLIEKGCGFVYSDAACFTDGDYKPRGYNMDWGWQSYPLTVYGQPFLATKTFPLTARTLCEVYYAPDHVRCWSREAYYKAGGHDPNMSVGDDHELMVRTYLAGTQFGYTESCGYLYRFHPKNTVKLRNQQIQDQVKDTREQHTRDLVLEWCKRLELPLVGIEDLLKDGLRFERDLYHGLGFPDNSVGAIRYDNLNRVPREKLPAFFEACYKALVPGGWLLLSSPTSELGHSDPLAKSYITKASFLWYVDKYLRKQLPDITAAYQAVQIYDSYQTRWHRQNNLATINADMCALKGQRHPGKSLI